MIVGINFMGHDFIADVDFRVTFWGSPESGPTYSSGGEPAEGPEWEIDSIVLSRDELGYPTAPFEATGALLECLSNSEEINDAIRVEIEEYGQEGYDD